MKNCWEFNKCGRQPGGEKVDELGECPTPSNTQFQGLNNGENAGRACWLVQASLCEGERQGDFYNKIQRCINCDFFKMVYQEEGEKFSYGMKELFDLAKQENSD